MQPHSCKFHFPKTNWSTAVVPVLFFFYFLLKHAEFSQFSIPVEGRVAASASCQIEGLYKDVKKGTYSLDLSPNGGLYCSPENVLHLLFICFYLFFSKFTPKITIFNNKLHDNYKLCMKTFSTENTLHLMNTGKQNHNRNDLQSVLLFCFLGRFVRKRWVTNRWL